MKQLTCEMCGGTDLIKKNITEHRKSALKIPNCFYKIFKNNDEDCQHRIASMDINM